MGVGVLLGQIRDWHANLLDDQTGIKWSGLMELNMTLVLQKEDEVNANIC